jgi:hypothetical protein
MHMCRLRDLSRFGSFRAGFYPLKVDTGAPTPYKRAKAMNTKWMLFTACVTAVMMVPRTVLTQTANSRIRVKVDVVRLPADVKMQLESGIRGALRSLGDVELVDDKPDLIFGVGPTGISGAGTNAVPLQICCTRPFASTPAARRLAEQLGPAAQRAIAEETKDVQVYLHAGAWSMPKGQIKSFAEQLIAGLDIETLEKLRREKSGSSSSAAPKAPVLSDTPSVR